MKFLGQSFSQGPYQPKFQQVRKGFIYFVRTLLLIFISRETARKKN